jgi:hypothetical protein
LKPNRPIDNGLKPARQEGAGESRAARFGRSVAIIGFCLYAVFAPHSVAGAQIALAPVALGWLVLFITTGRVLFHRTPLDLPLCLFLGWTVLSALFSEEPSLSLPKLQAIWVVSLFYLTHALITRRTAILIAALMILSGAAGALWSVYDITRGRGVMIEELTSESPFHEFQLSANDAVWRVNGIRVHAVAEIDEAIKQKETGERLPVSLIVRGEHAERPGFIVTEEMKARPSPSGIKSTGGTHRFRASGWTRHYETFSETLQILAQLALGLALAHLQRGTGKRRSLYLALGGSALLIVGIALTAMRTVMVAFILGAIVMALRAARGRSRWIVAGLITCALAFGALAVWRTRMSGALLLEDSSATLRSQVALNGLARIPIHPVFGHGMDAVKNNWTEWGFPGTDMVHLHSTPLQIAFERGLPALLFWLWLMALCWLTAARAEKMFRDYGDANRHGLLLGATGAIAGFFFSSLVNYNFGDAEVALVFWWLMGTVIVLRAEQ